MEGFIDMHCHILPEVDDGARNEEEMRRMLEMAYEEGIRCIIATPHHHPIRGHESLDKLKKQARILMKAAHAIDECFRIYLGTEIYFGQDIFWKLKEKQILTMNRRNYVLVEFSTTEPFSYLCQSLQQLQMEGYKVILAHVERYQCIVEKPELAEQLGEMGILLQVNTGSIIGEGGRKVKGFVRLLMKKDKIFCVGTDAHSADRRPPRMKKAAAYVADRYGEEYMRRIFFSNAMLMLRRRKKTCVMREPWIRS